MGIENIYRENLYSAVHLGVDALVYLGHRRYSATRQGQRFIKYDEDAIFRLAKKRHDKKAFMISAMEEIEMQEQLFKSDLFNPIGPGDHAWDSENLKKDTST
ncbi:hypothetical protein D9M72_372840 [compost metagenome]